jgi:hypothetical protein
LLATNHSILFPPFASFGGDKSSHTHARSDTHRYNAYYEHIVFIMIYGTYQVFFLGASTRGARWQFVARQCSPNSINALKAMKEKR